MVSQMLSLLHNVHKLAAMDHPPAPYRPAMRRTLQTCDPGDQCLTLTGHTGGVVAVAVFPDGLSVLTGSGDRTAAVWNAATGERTLTLTGHTYFVLGVASHSGRPITTPSASLRR